MIVRSPYQTTTGKTLALKANGNGFVQGIEIALGYDWGSDWKSNLSFSWMNSEVGQLLEKPGGSHRKLVDHDNDESTAKILKALSPLTGQPLEVCLLKCNSSLAMLPLEYLGEENYPF